MQRLKQFLQKPSVQGSGSVILGFGLANVIRFASNIIMARLLLPDAFGLMALANTFKLGIELLSDFGIGQSVIREPNGEQPSFYNTAWTLKGLRGVLLWLLCCLIAWPVAQGFQQPEILWLLPLVGLTSVFGGFSSTSIFILTRQLRQLRLVIYNLCIQLITTVIMIAWAAVTPTTLALAAGGVVGSAIGMVASHFLLKGHRNHLTWDQEALSEIKNFGRWMMAASGIEFLAGNLDRLMVGKLFPIEVLGTFSVARNLGDIPAMVYVKLSGNILFPLYSQSLHLDRQEFKYKVLKIREFLLLPTAIVIALGAGLGDILIKAVYPEEYHQAAWMFPIIILGIWFQVLGLSGGPIMMALGKPIYVAYANIARLFSIIAGGILGYINFEILGVVVATSFSYLGFYVALEFCLHKERLSFVIQDVKISILLVLVLGLVLGLRNLAGTI